MDGILTHHDIRALLASDAIRPADEIPVDRGFHLRLCLATERQDGVVGYRARRFAGVGELRTNYAGFFDPGFGYGAESGSSYAEQGLTLAKFSRSDRSAQ